ncbi:MAG TPA: O-GlcNAc transferase, partial [Verrucomicrobiae bacterium]|nr:O-GlcNAc transferase [Verrucomicrobiae bacterium]
MNNAWRSVGVRAALVVALTVVAYLPVRNAGFVFDDHDSVTDNRSLRTLAGLGRIWTDPRASFQYYPLTYTSFWAEYHLWGLRPAGYHEVNVLLHAVNAVLVGVLLTRLGVPGAWLAALLFALHPVQVESVAWISERKNVLCGLFYLSSLLAYLRFGEEPQRRWGFYALSLGLFVCALWSKTSAVSMPFAVLLLLWWKQGRVRRREVVALIPFVAAGAALGLVTAWVEIHRAGAHGPEWQMSLLERCLVAGRVVWFYAGKLLWPYPLMVIYPRWHIDSGVWWQYLFPCGAAAVVVALWRWRDRLGKAPLVGVAFFAGSLVPVPAFINIAFMRYSY